MPVSKALVVAALAALCAFVGTPGARGDVTPPSLVGETLTATSTDFFEVTLTCSVTSSVIDFSASGVAAGPYPGTFTESGSIVLSSTGQVTSFSADYSIMSAVGSVQGSKTLGAPAGAGTCASSLAGFDAAFDTPVSYTATIYPVTGGVFSESGNGNAAGERKEAAILGPILSADDSSIKTFTESFLTSNGMMVASTGGHVTGGGWFLDLTSGDQISFGFEVKGTTTVLHGTCTVIDHMTKARVHCLTADTLVVVGTDAIFGGMATVNGLPTRYRIEVHDMGEPSTLDDFSITTDSGFKAAGPLLGGNIQIHN
jgi:hypothetical protein